MFAARGAAVVHTDPDGVRHVLASAGELPSAPDPRDSTVAIDDQDVLLVHGSSQASRARGLLNAYAAYAKVMAERRRATEAEIERRRLAESDSTRTALLTAVSHDLRSPLAAVKVAVSSLRSDDVVFSADDQAELLETIEEATDRLTALVTNLLDMSRIHAGAVTVAPSHVNLARAVGDALADLDPGRFAVHVDPTLEVLADPGLLERVLANICENALKYTPEGTPVLIDSALRNGRATVRIADTGPGVPEGDHERLFVAFQRLGDVPQKDGVGLGLAVARGLTVAMGGTITTDTTPGGGLTFVLDLPLPEELA